MQKLQHGIKMMRLAIFYIFVFVKNSHEEAKINNEFICFSTLSDIPTLPVTLSPTPHQFLLHTLMLKTHQKH